MQIELGRRSPIPLLVLIAATCAYAQPASEQAPSQMPSVVTVPLRARPSPAFNAETATEAYLAEIPPAAKARSDAYFEGGYWLMLWDFLYGAAVSLLLLSLRWSAKLRDFAERVTRFRSVHAIVYWAEYLVLTSILSFPLAYYEGYVRERQYGLATQTFGPWFGDQLKALGLGLLAGAICVPVLLGVVRKLSRSWWAWSAMVTMFFLTIFVLITPVFIVPVFNKVTRLQDPKVTQPILSMAQANGIPVSDVFEIDASKQTTRMSANVSGFAGTLRVTLSDNLLRRGSLEEVEAVMGHEIGHYVLNHVYKGLVFFFILTVAGFAFLRWGLNWTLARWGARWQIRGIGDVAVVPLVLLLVSVFLFVLTPFFNSFIRSQEYEADIFGLNVSRQPDGVAQAAIHLGEYRKMDPGPIEEWIFYDHPSGRARIHTAMRWKAENLTLFQAALPAAHSSEDTPTESQ